MKRIWISCILSLPLTTFAAVSNSELAQKVEELNNRNAKLERQVALINQKYGDTTNNYLPNKKCSLIDFGDPLYLKHNYPYFYDIVTELDPKSTANKDRCFKGICISGLANFDLVYFDRRGDGFLAGSVIGVGIRPLFGIHQPQWMGSINNINLFVDTAINKWSSIHLDFVYANSSIKCDTFSYMDKDISNIYQNGSALKVNEAYILFACPELTPLFVQIGRLNANFGDYQPFPIFESLTQLISETRTGGVIAGVIFPKGFYGSASWTIAEQSLRDFEGNLPLFGAIPSYYDFTRNIAGKVGFRNNVCDVFFNLNASAIYNIGDANYINGAFVFLNKDGRANVPIYSPILQNQYFVLNRAPGLALHGDAHYDRFALGADFVTALSDLNPGDVNGHIRAWGVNGSVTFCPLGCFPSTFEIGYQGAEHAEIFQTVNACLENVCPIGPFGPYYPGNILPQSRFEASLTTEVLHNINVALAWIADQDFNTSEAGREGLYSNFVKLRVNANW